MNPSIIDMAEERSAFEEVSEPASPQVAAVTTETADVVMHDPFSQVVVNNEYAFA